MAKLRNDTVSLGTYRKILKEVRLLAKSVGCELRVYRRPVIWRGHGRYNPRREVYGMYNIETRKARVTSLGKCGRASILFTAFHELRHAQHHKEGLFANYYDVRHLKTEAWVHGRGRKPRKIAPLDPYVGLQAEQDCNNFAHEEMLKRGIWTVPKNYDMSTVYTYRLAQDLAKMKVGNPLDVHEVQELF